MAVTSFAVMNDRRGTARTQRKGGLYEIVNRKYTKKYRVYTNDVSDGPETILTTFGIPKVGESYALFNDSDALATCISVDCDSDPNSPYVWTLTVEFDTDRVVSAIIDNPLLQPADIRWQFNRYQIPMVRDAFATPLRNSSDEMFIDPIMRNTIRPVVTIQRNEVAFLPLLALAYQDTVNLDDFAGATTRMARMNVFTGERKVDAGAIYWTVTYEIEFRFDTHDEFVLDQGFRDINRKQFLDPLTGSVLSTPTLLNGRGLRLGDGNTTLSLDITAGESNFAVTSIANFPPLTPSPPNWYFEIRVDDEVMQVRKVNSPYITVVRGWASTTAEAHTSGATVKLEPYYRRYLPNRIVAFKPLNLPVV